MYKDNYNDFHYSIIINDKEEIVRLINSSSFGNINIWKFHSGELLKKIQVSNN